MATADAVFYNMTVKKSRTVQVENKPVNATNFAFTFSLLEIC